MVRWLAAGLLLFGAVEVAWADADLAVSATKTDDEPGARELGQLYMESRELLSRGDGHALLKLLLPWQERLRHQPRHALTWARVLSLTARAHYLSGDLPLAVASFERSLALRQAMLGADHPEAAAAGNDLAVALDEVGDYGRARQLYEHSLAVQLRTQGPDHPEVATTSNNLGTLLLAIGDWDAALPLFERSLAIWQQGDARFKQDVARVQSNLAVLADHRGDGDRALVWYQRSLETQEAVLGPMHPDIVGTLNNLALLHVQRGGVVEALGHLKRALAICHATVGARHPTAARVMDSLGIACTAQHQYGEAQRWLEQALAVREQTLGDGHPDVAITLEHLAQLWQAQGDTGRARPLLQRSLRLLKQALGPTHPDVAEALAQLAWLSWVTDPQAALVLHHEAVAIRSEQLRRGLLGSTPRERRLYLAAAISQMDCALTLARRRQEPVARHLVTRVLLERKGLGLEQDAQQWLKVQRQDGAAQALLRDLALARNRLARVALSLATEADEAARADRLRAAEQVTHLEEALAKLAGGARDQQHLATAEEVSSRLGAAEVLVDWQVFTPWAFSPTGLTRAGAHPAVELVAVVYRRDHPPRVHWLGPVAPMDDAIGKLRAAIITQSDYREAARKLYDLLFAPIAEDLAGASRLTLSPDGPLHFVPFAALPDDEGKLLIERYAVRQVSTPRSLLEPAALASTAQPPLVVADADFDRGVAGARSVGDLAQARTRSGDLKAQRFGPLPGTRTEAMGLASVLGVGKDRLLLQAAATETALKAVHGPRVLHVATHGFFLPDQPEPAWRKDGSIDAATLSRLEDPMLRSGLALAGFNARSTATGDDDGVLTATEMSGLDLRGTELVVLSACETGLGESKSGDGVYGLKRALAMAGAKTSAVTLWKVDDAATAALMQAWYGRMKAGEDRVEALRQVQLALLRGALKPGDATTGQRGLVQGNAPSQSLAADWSHPWFWSSVVLTGQDGMVRW